MKEVLLFVTLTFVFLFIPLTAGQRHLMRFPDVHEGSGLVVFVYGEDLWKAPLAGGEAARLTLNDGSERFPRFSPDGKTIAFTGQYDGNSDVYVMNVNGGDITRLTFHPDSDDVVGWHPLKNKIIFRSGRETFSRDNRLYMIAPDGSGFEPLIMHEASFASFSPDGKKVAYNKVRREYRTWKRYQGGLAQDIYLYDLETHKDVKLTRFKGTDRAPMWIGAKIYFSSDRDQVLNIYSYDTVSGKVDQLTRHREYDVRRPGMGMSSIVYELGGELWLLDVKTGKSAPIPVTIHADAPETRPFIKKVDGDITGYELSPSGKRALIVARGEVFTVPQENGPTRNLTQNSGSWDRDAVWSPDGKTIAYLSDKSGEYEIYLVDPRGKTEAVKLTEHKDGYRQNLRWSPDSKKIAFGDQALTFYYLDVTTRKITRVDTAKFENVDVSLEVKPIYDYAWSPDSRFLAYSKMDADLVTKVYIYSLETGKIQCASHGLFNDFNPVFTPDGEHLLFVSNRRFSPTFCDFEWEMVYKDMAGIYSLTLKQDGKPLLPLESDEGELEEKAAEKKDKTGKKTRKGKAATAGAGDKPVRVRIDFDGIAGRIEAIPLPRGNYRNLAVNDSAVFYLNKDKGDFNRFEFRSIGPRDLKAFDFKKRKEHTVIDGINGFKLSADGSHIVYEKRNAIGIIPSDAVDSQGKSISLDGLKMYYEPLKEWRQIFYESWRMERDFYYEPNMKGVDWPAMKEKYGRLLPYASCRQDIGYLVGELIGELNTSHTYVFGGDNSRRAERVRVGMLGADYQVDEKNNRYRFKKIYRVPDWSREVNPPLAGPGIDVKEGDYLLAVNGKSVNADATVYKYFQDLANKQVTIKVGSSPTGTGAREYTVKPLTGETRLRYQDWVENNRLTVEKASGGLIGYIHFPDTYTGSAIEFPKYFYSQTQKKGIIVDGRFNSGGLDPDIFLGRLDKKVRTYWTRRYSHHQTSPAIVTRAHFVCLTNRYAGSGGDELPSVFRFRKMGPIIGTRTWGGLVGVSMFIRMIDGGGLSAPDYRVYSPEGKWIIENIGVVPDIIVDLNSLEVARGYDAQLMKGLEVLMKKIKEDPRPWPKHDPLPVETFKK
jgi:tricorn protease